MSGMREIVIIPAWRRPDFLTACLSRLDLSDDGERLYLISLDRKHTAPVVEAADSFAGILGPKRVRIVKREHNYDESNSFNTLRAYGDAVEWGADLIYLVEDDVFTGLDFFTAHRQAHELLPDVFAVGGCNFFPGTDPAALNIQYPYHSLGVSFRPDVLKEHVLPHATVRYFANRSRYCEEKFGSSGHWDQDGLIEAVRRSTGRRFAVMDVPRAYHAGYTGYSRVGNHFLKPEETCRTHIVEAAAKLLRMSSADLNARALFDKDHQTVDLSAPRPAIATVRDGSVVTLRQ
jgi:hypothetical protein